MVMEKLEMKAFSGSAILNVVSTALWPSFFIRVDTRVTEYRWDTSQFTRMRVITAVDAGDDAHQCIKKDMITKRSMQIRLSKLDDEAILLCILRTARKERKELTSMVSDELLHTCGCVLDKSAEIN